VPRAAPAARCPVVMNDRFRGPRRSGCDGQKNAAVWTSARALAGRERETAPIVERAPVNLGQDIAPTRSLYCGVTVVTSFIPRSYRLEPVAVELWESGKGGGRKVGLSRFPTADQPTRFPDAPYCSARLRRRKAVGVSPVTRRYALKNADRVRRPHA